jgi:hypothetical protein
VSLHKLMEGSCNLRLQDRTGESLQGKPRLPLFRGAQGSPTLAVVSLFLSSLCTDGHFKLLLVVLGVQLRKNPS